MKRVRSARCDEDFGSTKLFLDDVTEIAAIVHEATTLPVTIKCDEHELTVDELEKLEGKEPKSVEVSAIQKNELPLVTFSFTRYWCRATGYGDGYVSNALRLGSVALVRQYLDEDGRCRVWYGRRTWSLGNIAFYVVVMLASIYGVQHLPPGTFTWKGFATQAITYAVILAFVALTMELVRTVTPKARIRLVKRANASQWTLANKLALAGVVAAVVMGLFGIWIGRATAASSSSTPTPSASAASS